ncbi:hypothetical protein DB345_21180 [Spartobacteria bacterium LR76]|nr:hypothetical protein DB345_21180 [Spartobacteria bacterium LR76]
MEPIVFFYNNIARFDLGFENPNRTAALLGMLMMLAWYPAILKRSLFWLSLACYVFLAALLLQTYSRGGILAAAVGTLILVAMSIRPWRHSWIVASGVVSILLVMYAFSLTATNRISSAWNGDRSVLNRIEFWAKAPIMLHDSPDGWGAGKSAEAYTQWYQDLNRTERFANPANLHLRILLEYSWPVRVIYVLGWALAFLLAFDPRIPATSPLFAILSVAFVSGIFTDFTEAWPLYLVPFLAVVTALALRVAFRIPPKKRHAGVLISIGSTFLFLLIASSVLAQGELPIHGASSRIVIGKSPQQAVIVDRKTLGPDFGRTYRSFRSRGDAPENVIFITSVKENTAPHIVLCGTNDLSVVKTVDSGKLESLTLINPKVFPEQLAPSLLARTKVIFSGLGSSSAKDDWIFRAPSLECADAGDYLYAWPSFLKKINSTPLPQ